MDCDGKRLQQRTYGCPQWVGVDFLGRGWGRDGKPVLLPGRQLGGYTRGGRGGEQALHTKHSALLGIALPRVTNESQV